jgi:hypothetical protein
VVATLGILAAVATLACLGTLVWVHLRPTGYNPLRDAVSDYGVGSSYPFYRAQTAAMALAAILVAGRERSCCCSSRRSRGFSSSR